jgi:predicted amidohydrolase YtcJ
MTGWAASNFIQKLKDDGLLTIRLAYNLFTQKPKGEKEDFLNWTSSSKYQQGDNYFRHNSRPCGR